MIKGWLEEGEPREQVFDIACSDGLTVDPVTHRCPDNGAIVDLSDCSTSAHDAATELKVLWQDPDFDADKEAFYYAKCWKTLYVDGRRGMLCVRVKHRDQISQRPFRRERGHRQFGCSDEASPSRVKLLDGN